MKHSILIMLRRGSAVLTGVLVFAAATATAVADPANDPLLQQHWFEARTPHFHAYSCGPTQAVARVVGRLEQFREAYSVLAGGQAVASPPVIVMAFADHEAMTPFLGLYQGKPANQAAFFVHGSDENLIVISLSGEASLDSIFHEYTHLLLRHNDRVWPPWLEEGMAEIYSTFAVSGGHTVRIGHPIERHLQWLGSHDFMPLEELLTATHDSAAYNEREHQGVFYAQSWLLTHYLMLGDRPELRTRFGQLTALLRKGQNPVQAFTNAFGISLAAMDRQLHAYFERGQFNPMTLSVAMDLAAPRSFGTRGIATPEVCFRLGDELIRIQRVDDAVAYFERARQIAPASPLGYEGLGLAAAWRDQHEEAARQFGEAVRRGSPDFLAHYFFAREKYSLTAGPNGTHTPLENDAAQEVRSELQKSLTMMPDFGPAQELMGFFEMVQGDDLSDAEQHLRHAIALEPEKLGYRFSLAQAQLRLGQTETARQTLESLCLPYVEAPLRAEAQNLIKAIDQHTERGR